MIRQTAAGIVALMLSGAGIANAEDKAEGGSDGEGKSAATSSQDLQTAAQNPIADLISVPFQNNFNFGVGERDVTQYVLNIQPVYPATLSPDWNLIIRPIIPIINQPKAFDSPAYPSAFGLGDINLQLYFSPSHTVESPIGSISWGFGPTLVFPSATDDILGSSKWSAGPGAVAFISKRPFTYGALVNNVWSFAGEDDVQSVNQLLIQPFVNYNLSHGWSIGSAPIVTADWEADSDDRWTVPVGGGVGKLTRIGGLPVQANLRAYYNAVTPEYGADWQLQLQLTFLFPR